MPSSVQESKREFRQSPEASVWSIVICLAMMNGIFFAEESIGGPLVSIERVDQIKSTHQTHNQ
jgi:hypothetical protein